MDKVKLLDELCAQFNARDVDGALIALTMMSPGQMRCLTATFTESWLYASIAASVEHRQFELRILGMSARFSSIDLHTPSMMENYRRRNLLQPKVLAVRSYLRDSDCRVHHRIVSDHARTYLPT